MHTLRPTLLSLLALCAPGLSAQAPVPWQPLCSSPSEGVDLRWVLKSSETAWVMEVKNFGSTFLHFNFRLMGIQTLERAQENGRVHLAPGAKFVLPLEMVPSGLAVTVVRIDEGDAAPLWRD